MIHRITKLPDTVYDIQANMATKQNRSPIEPPNYESSRFAPLLTATGKQQRGEFKATYSCEVEFYYSPNTCLLIKRWICQTTVPIRLKNGNQE